MRKVTLSNKDVSELFGVTVRQVSNWANSGMPKLGHGKYELLPVFTWWRVEMEGSETKGTQAAKDRYWVAKAEQAELATAKEKGKLISLQACRDSWAVRIGVVRQSLLSLPIRLPSELEGRPNTEIRDALQREVDSILDHYSRPGEHCQVTEEPKKRGRSKKSKRA